MQDEKVNVLFEAAKLLADDKPKDAEQIVNEKYPFIPIKRKKRRYTTRQLMEQFFRYENANSISISIELEN